jgi:hypothetical protein
MKSAEDLHRELVVDLREKQNFDFGSEKHIDIEPYLRYEDTSAVNGATWHNLNVLKGKLALPQVDVAGDVVGEINLEYGEDSRRPRISCSKVIFGLSRLPPSGT